jgi:hypothetical protein
MPMPVHAGHYPGGGEVTRHACWLLPCYAAPRSWPACCSLRVFTQWLPSFLIPSLPHPSAAFLPCNSEYKFLEYQQFHSVENTKKQKEM